MIKTENIFIDGKKVNYIYKKGKLEKTLVFIHGYFSNIFGEKALLAQNIAISKGLNYLSVNLSGHGVSEGDIKNQTITDWLNEIKTIINLKGLDNIIFVGSSLGAWLMFLLAGQNRYKVDYLIGIGSALDFSLNLINKGSEELLNKDGYIEKDGLIFGNQFIKDSKKHLLLIKDKIPLLIPLCLLHGEEDKSVNPLICDHILSKYEGVSAFKLIKKNEGHRFSSKEALSILDMCINLAIENK